MSIAILHQVYDETRRLAIAGSSVAPGDFRVKKLIPALEQAGTKSPVFAKLAQSATALVEATEATSPAALLELGTLITSILYTQGETGIAGELEPIDTIDLGLSRTQTPAKLLKPLLEALTSKGSGRLDTIRTSHEQGLFQDLRLIRPALLALDDSYSEIAEYVAQHVLPLYGPALIPELEAQFNPKGGAGHPRRLLLMHKLDANRTKVHVRTALDEGNAEMRVAAIECMGSSNDDLQFLLEQIKSKSKLVRRAAMVALARMNLDAADTALINQIDSSELENAREALQSSQSPVVLATLLNRTHSLLSELLKVTEKVKGAADKQIGRFLQLMSCLERRDSPEVEAFHLELLKSIDQIKKLKGSPGGGDIAHALAANLASGSECMKRALCKSHADFAKEETAQIFCAAFEVLSPQDLFKTFSPYLIAFRESVKKKKDLDAGRGEVIAAVLSSPRYNRYSGGWYQQIDVGRLSKKWLELAIKLELDEITTQLAALDKKISQPALLALFSRKVNAKTSSTDFWELSGVLEAMIQVEHPALIESVIEVIKKLSTSSSYYGLWILRHITSLPPQDAIPKLETLLPTLSDKIANTVIEAIIVLKQMS